MATTTWFKLSMVKHGLILLQELNLMAPLPSLYPITTAIMLRAGILEGCARLQFWFPIVVFNPHANDCKVLAVSLGQHQ